MILTTFTTADGPFTVLFDGRAVWASGWTDSAAAIIERVRAAQRPAEVSLVDPGDPRVAGVRTAIDAFYDGDLTAPQRVEVRQFGTLAQQQGWSRLREIAPGQPLSYAEFANTLGTPRAVRAAASICARNAPALFVPCHRVLRSDGSLGGFAWGTDVKQSLLQRERAARP
jgi:methylated-DNA-[protein]-cysteine S-methyltransferase